MQQQQQQQQPGPITPTSTTASSGSRGSNEQKKIRVRVTVQRDGQCSSTHCLLHRLSTLRPTNSHRHALTAYHQPHSLHSLRAAGSRPTPAAAHSQHISLQQQQRPTPHSLHAARPRHLLQPDTPQPAHNTHSQHQHHTNCYNTARPSLHPPLTLSSSPSSPRPL